MGLRDMPVHRPPCWGQGVGVHPSSLISSSARAGQLRFRGPILCGQSWAGVSKPPAHLPRGKTPLITGQRGPKLRAHMVYGKTPLPHPSPSPSPGRRVWASVSPPALTCPRSPADALGSQGLLQRLLVMRVLELPVFPLGGPADSHRSNGHPSLGRLGCLRKRRCCQQADSSVG